MEKAAAIFLGLNGFMFVAVGCASLFDLAIIINYLGLAAETLPVNASNDLRANYGGLYAGFGCALAIAAVKRAQRPVAYLWLAIIFLGVILGRLIDMMQNGMPGGAVMAFLGTEVVTLAIATGFYLRYKKAGGAIQSVS